MEVENSIYSDDDADSTTALDGTELALTNIPSGPADVTHMDAAALQLLMDEEYAMSLVGDPDYLENNRIGPAVVPEQSPFSLPAKASKIDTCPICDESKTDVVVLDHWDSSGDISEHKMCAECRSKYKHSQCPFCREILCKEEFLNFIHYFVNAFVTSSAGRNRDQMAQLFEEWQMLEMELEGNIIVLNRMARLIIEDEVFGSVVREAILCKKEQFRELSGIIFRFYGLVKDSGLVLKEHDLGMLEDAISFIVGDMEGARPVRLNSGHNYAALYMQALVPLLCARNSGCSLSNLVQLVRRVGNAIIHGYVTYGRDQRLYDGIKEYLQVEYLSISHQTIWGSIDNDPMWNTFIANEYPMELRQRTAPPVLSHRGMNRAAPPRDESNDPIDNSPPFPLYTRVRARFRGGQILYPGIIARVHANNYYDIHYDDGDVETRVMKQWIAEDHSTRQPPQLSNTFALGDRVEARWSGGTFLYPGVITAVNEDGSYNINYDDGDTEQNVPFVFIRHKAPLQSLSDQLQLRHPEVPTRDREWRRLDRGTRIDSPFPLGAAGVATVATDSMPRRGIPRVPRPVGNLNQMTRVLPPRPPAEEPVQHVRNMTTTPPNNPSVFESVMGFFHHGPRVQREGRHRAPRGNSP